MKIKKKSIALTLVITILVSTSLIVNAKISEEINLFATESTVDNVLENSSGYDNQNDSFVPKPLENISKPDLEYNQTQSPTENGTYPKEGNETKPPSGNGSNCGPMLELFTMQEKGANYSGYGVKETRWLSHNALMINVGVWVNCGLNLVDGYISLDNLTLNLMYEIKGNESDMLRCNVYFDLYYIISNIEQSDFTNIELVQEINLQ